jgi:hypothetical protein
MAVSRLLTFLIQINLSEKYFLPCSWPVRPQPHNLVGGYVRKAATKPTFGGSFLLGTIIFTVQYGG